MTVKRQSTKLSVVLLYCQNTAKSQHSVQAAAHQAVDCVIRSEMMPCSSRVQTSHLLKILEKGADAIEVVACPENSCRMLVGSRRAEKRVEYAHSLLTEIGISSECIGLTRTKPLATEELVELACVRAQKLRGAES